MLLNLKYTFLALGTMVLCQQGLSEPQLLWSLSDDILAREAAYAKEIAQTFPSDKNFILSLGTSNVVVDSFLRNHYPDEKDQASYLSTIPVGRLRDVMRLTPEQSDLFWFQCSLTQKL